MLLDAVPSSVQPLSYILCIHQSLQTVEATRGDCCQPHVAPMLGMSHTVAQGP